ncbi:cobalamin binding intrinsic factor-like isoform 2-T2 [Anomaloglossus baeobatrachus]
MKQVILLCAGLISLIHSSWANGVCYVADTQKSAVTSLAVTLARSVGPCVPPDPSVLLAMRLGKIQDSFAQELLVNLLKEDAVQKINNNQTFTSGKVALYVLALHSSCSDPTILPNSAANLVQLLETKTQEELDSIENNGSPLTTFYQVGLDMLAMCVMTQPSAITAANVSAINILATGQTSSVDTAAVLVMAFTCVLDMEDVPLDIYATVNETLGVLLDFILNSQNGGLIGNIYSTGLAGQALTVAKPFYAPERWNCSQTLNKMIELIPENTFSLPIAAAQLLPLLWGKSYVSAKKIVCPCSEAHISVELTIMNDLYGENFKYSTIVSVKKGSTLLEVMQQAQALDPENFRKHK